MLLMLLKVMSMNNEAHSSSVPFWHEKTLEEMTGAEWESLCDGCGRCCLVKLEDEDTGEIHYTDVACTLFDAGTCRCRNYVHRQKLVADCVRLTPNKVRTLSWLPPTCAYRLLAEGKGLSEWHPLISGDRDSVRKAGISVHGRIAGSEDDYSISGLMDQIVTWPAEERT